MDRAVGVLMRAYRRSPLYPAWGQRFAKVLARMPGGGRSVVKEVDGVVYELDLREVIDSSLYYSGTFEIDTEQAISSRLRPGMTAIDIGANVGYHTFRMARGVGPGGTVLALEPMSHARHRLERNLELNDFANIRVLPIAVSDANVDAAEVSFVNSYRLDGRATTTTETVRVATLDSLVEEAGLSRVDFIKLDVDGYEGKVLRGATRVLDAWSPTIVFEISPGAMAAVGDDAMDLVADLQRRGYRLLTETGEPLADIDALLARVGDFSVNLVAEAPPG